jgi:hypothetical protein
MIWRSTGVALRISVLVLLPLLAACGSDDYQGESGGGAIGGNDGGSTPDPAPLPSPPDDPTDPGSGTDGGDGTDGDGSSGGGSAPALPISGVPPSGIKPGENYLFHPRADNNGGTVVFSITNKPAWASFEPATGKLRGTPRVDDIGTTDNIVISASDGTRVGYLAPFSIAVNTTFPGVISVHWQAPVENDDGTQLLDLAGYRIYLGLEHGRYTRVIDVREPDATAFTVGDLPPNLYYVAATAYDRSGLESVRSNVIQRLVN